MNSPDLSVIIVSHNHGAYLGACLRALAPVRHPVRVEVLVVDNVSTDDTAAVVAGFPWARLMRNTARQGFAANNNQALRVARGRHAMLLNPDTEARPGALERLVAFLDDHPRVGLCGPQLRFPDDSIQPSCRRFPTVASVLARRTPLRRWLWRSSFNARHLMEDLDHTRTQAVDWLLGACMMVRRPFLETVGLLDPGFFLYVEDIDWGWRARGRLGGDVRPRGADHPPSPRRERSPAAQPQLVVASPEHVALLSQAPRARLAEAECACRKAGARVGLKAMPGQPSHELTRMVVQGSGDGLLLR